METHAVWFYNGIHEETQFLPWHRWYLLKMENLLRQMPGHQCITIPYWASEYEVDPWTSKHLDSAI